MSEQRLADAKYGMLVKGANCSALAATALTAALVSTAVAPVIRSLMIRADVLDVPNERSSHKTPVPRGGGWACIAGTVAGLMVARRLGHQVPWRTVTGAVALGLVGFVDDRWTVSANSRLLAQGVTGAATGTSVFSAAFGMAVVPSVVNAVNFMDGINGISSLTSGAWGINAILEDDEGTRALGAALAGAMLGFLPHNVRKNRMFLGDVGSYFMGGLISMSVLQAPDWRSKMNTAAPLAVYLVDTGTTLVRRRLRGANITAAHREHTYQVLANERHWGHLAVSLYVALSSLAAAALIRDRKPLAAVAIVAIYLAVPLVPDKSDWGLS